MKMDNNTLLMFVSWIKTYLWANQYSRIGIIVPFAINSVIYRMWGFRKIPTDGKKPRVRPSDMEMNMGTMGMYKYEHDKNSKSTEELSLSQYCQATS